MQRMPNRAEHLAWRLRGGVIAVAAVAVFAVGACGSPNAGATTTPATAAPPTAAGSGAPASAGADYTSLTIAQNATVGAYVTGKDGMSLYVFTPDSGATSACVDKCAQAWPPLTVEDEDDAQAGAGVTGDLGTITRADGTKQLTLGGHPLYYFANDKAAGDLNGQGLNGKWFAAGPDGSGLGMGAAPSPTSAGKPGY
jgi:predicted lipoprotein with Yx(FWY)xxD motif